MLSLNTMYKFGYKSTDIKIKDVLLESGTIMGAVGYSSAIADGNDVNSLHNSIKHLLPPELVNIKLEEQTFYQVQSASDIISPASLYSVGRKGFIMIPEYAIDESKTSVVSTIEFNLKVRVNDANEKLRVLNILRDYKINFSEI